MTHYTRTSYVSVDESSRKIVALAVGIFGHLGNGESELFDQLAARIVDGRDRGYLAMNVICKEHLLEVKSATT